ncbi:cytochrome P450 87A3-like [Tasmannia lanceolata]|uniref:cytochrome P450 87A3-like n=1 Tax=Tasmannia lanceolata TaxID=3420 RepID=UPI004063BD50
MWPVALCLGTLVIVLFSHLIYRWKNPKCNGKLPPGSMGFPLLGESFSFFSPYTSSDINPFIKKRMERYGSIFKTSLVGKPFVISTDEEFNHFIFQQEGRLFQSWYPDSFKEVLGSQNPSALHGFMYKHLKNLILSFFGIESLKENHLHEVDPVVQRTLNLWSKEPSIELREAAASMIFDFTAKKLVSYDGSKSSEKLRENFVAFFEGLISFPIYIPGTAYYRCMQGRKNVLKLLKNMLHYRRANPEKRHGDFFDRVIDDMNKEQSLLTEAIALDMIFILLFVSYETTSAALTVAIKLLTDHPKVLEKLTEEHEEILRRRKDPESKITWDEYKSMTFTSQVINETLRLANIAPGIFRRTLEDVKIKGHTIPAGWGVMVCPPAVHLNPATYEDPLSFNPWRWEGVDINRGSKNFMAFGGGMRICVGANYSKLLMMVCLHHLVTKYRWEKVKGGEIVRTPGLAFPNGFHIRLSKKNK